MGRWNRLVLCGALCLMLGLGLACKKDEDAEGYTDNTASATTEESTTTTDMTNTEEPTTTEMGTEMGTDMAPPPAPASTPP
jgi:hypothetical protein